MDLLQIIVLALLQGLTEFLPISSSAHLILVPVLTDWEDQGLAFDVAVHVGTLSAVVWYFRHELQNMTLAWFGSVAGHGLNPDSRLAWAVLFGTLPAALGGLLFHDFIGEHLRSPLVIAATTLVFGLLLAVADKTGAQRRDEHSIHWLDVLLIGGAQALALIPGTSRSGITMSVALLLGLTRTGAARFSFLLSVPIILMAGGYESLKLVKLGVDAEWLPLVLGAVLSGLSAYLCIHFFLKLLDRIGLMPFVYYRLGLGVLLLMLFW